MGDPAGSDREHEVNRLRRVLPTVFAAISGVVLVVLIVVWALDARRFATTAARASREFAKGRRGDALADFEWLAARRPGEAAFEYPLGVCALDAGKVDEALAAFARVPEGSNVHDEARLTAARAALDHGRLRVAEDLIVPLAARRGEIGDHAREMLDELDLLVGRLADIRARARARNALSLDDPIAFLRKRWLIDTERYPVTLVRDRLQRLAKEAPNDDRVRLAQANLATRAGLATEADELLAKCEARAPGDPAVARARIDWAVSNDRIDDLVQRFGDLKTNGLTHQEVLKLRARAAAWLVNVDLELAALRELVVLDSSDALSLGRLTALETSAGDPARAAKLRAQKTQIDVAREAYRTLLERVDAGAHASELARYAFTLGRFEDAAAWWAIRLRTAPDDAVAKQELERAKASAIRPKPSPNPGTTISDLLADILKPKAAAD